MRVLLSDFPSILFSYSVTSEKSDFFLFPRCKNCKLIDYNLCAIGHATPPIAQNCSQVDVSISFPPWQYPMFHFEKAAACAMRRLSVTGKSHLFDFFYLKFLFQLKGRFEFRSYCTEFPFFLYPGDFGAGSFIGIGLEAQGEFKQAACNATGPRQ
jgi:hypothetical protein